MGWIAYGLLFLIHPVWGAGAAVVLMGCFLRVGDGSDYWQQKISEMLGIDASEGMVVSCYDDHSGFHGDGTSYAILSFEDEILEQGIAAPGGWKKLPLDHNLETLIYGTRTETKATGPYIGIIFPRVEEGYWYFYDCQGETHEDDLVLTRGSYNYIFAVYDTHSDKLYYCEYDT